MLNPNADEWRPTPHHPHYYNKLPNQIFDAHTQLPATTPPPPPPQAVQLVSFSPLPPRHPCLYTHPHPRSQGFLPHHAYTHYHHQPFCHFSFPVKVTKPLCEDETTTEGSEINHGKENEKSDEEKNVERRREETPKCPQLHIGNKGVRRVLPPRLRRAKRYFHTDKKALLPRPRPWKLVWEPKKSANPDSKVSGDGDAAHSRPPISHFPPPSGADRSGSSHSLRTTVMIKNIPNQLRRDFMLNFLDGYCKLYSLEFDFFYLPMDFSKGDNLGYAFVNFTTPHAATKFKMLLQNYEWRGVQTDGGPINSRKSCEITWARIQGKEAQIRRFKNVGFACNRWDFLPVILDPPRNGSDPNPPPPVILGKPHGLQ